MITADEAKGLVEAFKLIDPNSGRDDQALMVLSGAVRLAAEKGAVAMQDLFSAKGLNLQVSDNTRKWLMLQCANLGYRIGYTSTGEFNSIWWG